MSLKRIGMIFALLIGAVGSATVADAQCGIAPVTLHPLVARCNAWAQKCACDNQGHCAWVWVCVG